MKWKHAIFFEDGPIDLVTLDMLFRVAPSIKLLEFWRLVATGHVECINPLSVRLGVELSFAGMSSKLCLDCISNQVLDLSNGHHS